MKQPDYLRRVPLSELKTKAARLGIVNYNDLQRKARAINTSLGTQYSPKTILYWELKAREQGNTTAAYRAVTSAKGVRADVSYTPTFDDMAFFNRQQFGALAAKVPQIDKLLSAKSGDFLDRGADVWRETKVGDGSKSVWTNVTTGQIRNEKPEGIAPVTPARVREAIYKIRDVVDKSGGGSNTYEGYIDIYLSDV